MLKLYTFHVSSASFRVRCALALKNIPYEAVQISLAGQHKSAEYLAVNPEGRVPALDTGHGILTQSLAILDWLEETHPTPSLYPVEAMDRARCRAFAHIIASDIFPLQNMGTRQKLGAEFGADEARQAQWAADWIAKGFASLEIETATRGWQPGTFLFGDTPTLADICLVPQMNNARRYKVDLTPFPLLNAADAKARAHPAFEVAALSPQD